MALSFGIPLGLLVVLVGVILHFFTRYKIVARLLIGVGLAVAALTLLVIWVGVSSGM